MENSTYYIYAYYQQSSGLTPFQYVLTAIGSLQAIIIAIIAGIFTKESKKRADLVKMTEKQIEKLENLADLRAEESKLSLRMIFASLKLGVIAVTKHKRGKLNGILDEALEEAKTAKADYNEFINDVAKQHIEKDFVKRRKDKDKK